jgi:hypothetical protein
MKNIGRNARPVALVVTLKIKNTITTAITGMNLNMTVVFRIVTPIRDIRDVSNNVNNTTNITNTIIMNIIKAATLIRNAGIVLA